MTDIVRLINDNKYAKKIIINYCSWQRLNIPFTYLYKKETYAKSADLWTILNHGKRVSCNRHNYADFFLNIGCIKFEDTTERAKITNDKRYLVSWLHSPSATAVFLLNDQPLFTAFIGKDGSVSPKYNICYLSELYIPKSQVLDFNVKKSA